MSNFDVRPADGVELPPIGVVVTSAGVPNSYFSYANNPAVSGAPLPGSGHVPSKYGAPTPYSQPKVPFFSMQHVLAVFKKEILSHTYE